MSPERGWEPWGPASRHNTVGDVKREPSEVGAFVYESNAFLSEEVGVNIFTQTSHLKENRSLALSEQMAGTQQHD